MKITPILGKFMHKAHLLSRRTIALLGLLLFVFSMPSFSQKIEIKGRIINQDGLPVDAAIVTVNVTGQNEHQSLEFSMSDTSSTNGSFQISFTEMAADTEIVIADRYKVSAIYPNPGGELRGVKIDVMQAGNFCIDIYNSVGAFVANVFKQELPAGVQHIRFKLPDGIASGIFFAKIACANQTTTIKFTHLAGSIDAQGALGFSETRLIPANYVIKCSSVNGGNEKLVIPTNVDFNRTIDESFDLGDLKVQTVASQIIISGKAINGTGLPVSELEVEAFFAVNDKLRISKTSSSGDGSFSIIYSLPKNEVTQAFRASVDSLVFNGNYVLRTTKILNLPFMDYNTGAIVVNQVAPSVTISGKTVDVFGESLPANVTAHLTINGMPDSIKGASDTVGNFALIYSLDPSKVVPGFSANIDSVVCYGVQIPCQVIKRSGFADMNLGNIMLDNFAGVAITVYDVIKWPDIRVGLVRGKFIGENQSFEFTTGIDGERTIILPAGEYDVELDAEGFRHRNARVDVFGKYCDVRESMIKRETNPPVFGVTTNDGMHDLEMELLSKYGTRFVSPPKTAIDTTGLGSKAERWNKITFDYLKELQSVRTILFPEGFFDFSNVEIINNWRTWEADQERQGNVYMDFYYFTSNRLVWGYTGSNKTPQGALKSMSPNFNSTLPDSGFLLFKGVGDTICIGYKDIIPHEVSGVYFGGRPDGSESVRTVAAVGPLVWSLKMGNQPFDIKAKQIMYSRGVGYIGDLILKDQDPDFGKPKVGPSREY